MAVDWTVDIQVMTPIPFFDRPLRVEVETQSSPAYSHEGRCYSDRKKEIIIYTLSGEGFYEDQSGSYALTPESCVLCNPGDPEILYRYPADATLPWQFLWVGFTGVAALNKFEAFRKTFGPCFHLSFKSPVIQKLLRLNRYNNTTLSLRPIEGEQFILDILTDLYQSCTVNHINHNAHQAVEECLNLINAHNFEKISVNYISELLNISREHLSRMFKASTGTSLQKYILERKIQRACRLLKDTDLSVKEISSQLGFKDQRNFTRTFRIYTDMTPRDFKNSSITPIYMKQN